MQQISAFFTWTGLSCANFCGRSLIGKGRQRTKTGAPARAPPAARQEKEYQHRASSYARRSAGRARWTHAEPGRLARHTLSRAEAARLGAISALAALLDLLDAQPRLLGAA